MSFYATIVGTIQYENQADFDQAIELLKNGFIEEGFFIDERGVPVSDEPTIDASTRTIEIPFHYYRNLAAALDRLFSLHGRGRVVWTSTDGVFKGGIIEDGKETPFNLTEWASENVAQKQPNPSKQPQRYVHWQRRVEQKFFEDNPASLL